MDITLLLDDDDARASEISRRIAADAPGMEVRRVRNGVELRYAAACSPPAVVVLGGVPPPHRARALAWEMRAMRPRAWIVALARDDADEQELATLGEGVSVVGPGGDKGAREVGRVCRRVCRRGQERTRPTVAVDAHRFQNRIAGLLAGMHAFAAELRATAHDPDRVHALADEYVERLTGTISDLSAMIAASQSTATRERVG